MGTPETSPSKINTDNNMIPATYIEDINLAWEVARGEYQHTVDAIQARKSGRYSKYSELMNLATEAGDAAGGVYTVYMAGADETYQEQNPSLWDNLTSEQLDTAEKSRTAMSAEFSRPKSDFGLIEVTRTDDNGNETSSTELTLTATDGLSLGDPSKLHDPARSWNTIMGKKNWITAARAAMGKKNGYYIHIDEEEVCMTAVQDMDFYRALVIENPEIRSFAWIFAESDRADRDYAPVAAMFLGSVSDDYPSRRDFDYGMKLYPAVKIA